FVANNGGNTVSVIDGRTHALLGTIAVVGNPYNVAVYPAGRKVFVSNSVALFISIINIDQGAFGTLDAANLLEGSATHGIAVDNTNGRLYVTSPGFNTVSVWN